MRNKPPEPIWLPLYPSRCLIAYLSALHALTLTALAVLQASPALRAAAALAVIASLLLQVSRHALLLGNKAVRRVHWRADGSWWLTDGAGRVQIYPQAEPEVLHPWLVVLRLRGRDEVRRLLLAGDCASTDTLRRLRIRLRRQQATDSQAGPLRGT